MENVTHLKNSTIFLFGAFKCGPAFEPLAHRSDALPSPWEIVAELSSLIQWCESSFSFFFDFRDFFEKHLHFFIRYLMGISKYSQNATRQYQTLFYFIVNHQLQWYKSRYAVK